MMETVTVRKCIDEIEIEDIAFDCTYSGGNEKFRKYRKKLNLAPCKPHNLRLCFYGGFEDFHFQYATLSEGL